MEEPAEKPKWYKDKYTLIFISIIILAIALRFYYFYITSSQPLWWDEAEYMSTAKAYAGRVSFELGGQRLPGFPMLMSSFFFLGIDNEAVIRFIALFLPSIIVLILVYLVIKEMYSDKRIALISVSIMAVLWEHLFYSNRFHTENFALIFQLFAFLVIFRGYLNKKDIWIIKSKYSLAAAALLSLISVVFRPGNIPFIPVIILFILILDKNKIFNKKAMPYLLTSIAILSIISFFIISNLPKGGIMSYWHSEFPLAWNTLSVFSGFYESVIPGIPPILYYAFLLGILLLIIDLILGFRKIRLIKNDSENMEIKSDLFNALLIIAVLFTFIFIVRTYTGYEYRWFFPLIIGMLVFTSKGIITFSEYLGMLIKNKPIVIVLIILILSLGLYTQYIHADSIIKMKIGSYADVKDAALWMKNHTSKGDIIFSESFTQNAYYSERKSINFGSYNNESDFEAAFNKLKPKYITLSIFEKHPDWIYSWSEKNNKTVQPVKIYYADNAHEQISLIIYEVDYQS